LIAKDDRQLLILIPDLDIMLNGTPVRCYMDNDASRNVMTLGMSEYQVKEHVLFTRKPGAQHPAGDVEFAIVILSVPA
jgi:hypothetical protein